MSIPAGPPKDYTALAIIGTILSACTSCIGLITGIIAIVQNNKAQKLYAAGDIAGSYSAANTAKILLIVTWVLVTSFGDVSNAGRFNLEPAVADYLEHLARVQQNGFLRTYAELCTDPRPRPITKGLESPR